MEAFLGFLLLSLFIFLIVGLVKPSVVLKWDAKPTRLKVVGYYFLGTFILGIAVTSFSDNVDSSDKKITRASKLMGEERYEEAMKELKSIEEGDSLFAKADSLLAIADSIANMTAEEKKAAELAAIEAAKEEELVKKKAQLEGEIKSIDEGIDFSGYRGDVNLLTLEVGLFGLWSKLINEGQASEDPEMQKLAGRLKAKVAPIFRKEFPKLRKDYAEVLAKKLWENNITVTYNGTGNRYINFTGGLFADNKNKKDFQVQAYEALKTFRFNQSRYRWYKGESEYTYYTIFEGKDSDLIDL